MGEGPTPLERKPPRSRGSLPATRTVLLLAAMVLIALTLILYPRQEGIKTPNPVGDADQWTVIGSAGLHKGGFNQPRGITGLPDGGFFVADRKARMQRFDARGQAVELWEMRERKLGNPKSLTVLPNGHLLICDTHYARLLETTLAGEIIKQWGGPGMEPGKFGLPQACAVDAEAKAVYVADYGGWTNDRLHKFSLDGTLIKAWGGTGEEPGRFRRATGVAMDERGDVYVSDSGNHRVQKFTPEGELLFTFGQLGDEPGDLRYPYDIACSPDQKLYVAEFGNHRISVFDTRGTFLHVLGTPGAQDPGQFFHPWSLTVDSFGRLLVSDTANHRIQILQVSRPASDRARIAKR